MDERAHRDVTLFLEITGGKKRQTGGFLNKGDDAWDAILMKNMNMTD